jgi:GR25 family glycosyltransferase involved in LPS biosynthesis
MTTIEDYFDKIIVINRDARIDRWTHCLEQFRKFNLTKVERFSALDHASIDGHIGGNGGCTASHRCILDAITFNKWPRTLILEDDFEIIHDDFHAKFAEMIGEVPDDWQMLYLGGHYAEKPQGRVSQHVIRMARMMTTSSYGVTYQMAREMAPVIYGSAPIDTLYYPFHLSHKCYIFQPRLMVQFDSFSDLQGRESSNRACMSDENHSNMV